ncbi:MAG: L-2-amino-thiazoline-4-carboxylic acid hydrolase [Promethearchaeota archaeon]
MPEKEANDATYYIKRKAKIIKELNKTMKTTRQVLASHYGDSFSEKALEKTIQEFDSLLPQLPYIGGDKNPLTKNLVFSAAALALYRVLKAHSKSVEETGRILYESIEAEAATVSRFKRWLARRLIWSRFVKNRLKRMAAESQKCLYPENWVGIYIEGDGKNFNLGLDYTECGICKFYHKQGADELTPYLCILDFPMSRARGSGLIRTTTLAEGGDRCDFRFKRGHVPTQGWPPTSKIEKSYSENQEEAGP